MGLGSSGLQKVSSSLKEVGNLPTWFIFHLMLFWSWLSPRGCLVLFPDTKIEFFLVLEL